MADRPFVNAPHVVRGSQAFSQPRGMQKEAVNNSGGLTPAEQQAGLSPEVKRLLQALHDRAFGAVGQGSVMRSAHGSMHTVEVQGMPSMVLGERLAGEEFEVLDTVPLGQGAKRTIYAHPQHPEAILEVISSPGGTRHMLQVRRRNSGL